jgi:hypothetical protein
LSGASPIFSDSSTATGVTHV